MQRTSSVRVQHKLSIPVFFMAAVVVAIILIAVISGSYSQDGQLFGGPSFDYSEGWTIRDGTPISIPGAYKDNGSGNIVIVNTLPASIDNNSVLFIRSSYQALTVRVNGSEIYHFNLAHKALFIRDHGLSCYIITIPASAGNQTIELTLTPSQSGDVLRIFNVTLGSAISATSKLILDNLDIVVLFFFLVILCILILTFTLIFRQREAGHDTVDLFYFMVFIALSAIWILFDSELVLLFSTNIAFTQYCSIYSLMLLPVPLLFFVQRFLRKYNRLFHGLIGAVLLNFFVCNILAIFGVADLIQTLVISHILELLTCILCAGTSIVEYTRHKRRELLSIPLGLGFYCVFIMLEVIIFSITGNPSSAILYRIGLVVFILCVSSGLVRSSFGELTNSRSYANLARSIPSGICRIENFDSWRIMYANDFYFRMFGYTPAEAKAADFLAADFTVLPEDLPAMKEKIRKNFSYNFYRLETEARHRKKNGDIIWVLSRYTLEPFGRGAITAVMIDITDRKQMEEQLRISEEEYRIATRHSNKMLLRFDLKTRTCYSQQDSKQVFGPPTVLENIPDSIIESGIVAQDSVASFRSFFDSIIQGDRDGSVIISMFNRNSGDYGWYHFDFTSIFSEGDKPVQAIITFYDVTHQRQKELAFQRWQQSYNSIPKNATNYYEYNLTGDVFELEEGGMLPSIPASIPRKLSDISQYISTRFIFPDDRSGWLEFMSRERLLDCYSNGQYTDKLEFRRQHGNDTYWTAMSVQLIPDPYSANVKVYFLLEDIDSQKKAELILQERSMRDSLTGLLNRGSFIEQFNDILSKSNLETQHALIMLDVDNFKTINDTLGHATGDALLVNISGKLKYALRAGDLCGRLGGDEFVIFLRNMNRGKPLETRVSDLCSLVCNEKLLGISVSASFGIASFPNDGTTFEELYKKADIALYKVKQQGRGGFALYTPQLSFDDLTLANRH